MALLTEMAFMAALPGCIKLISKQQEQKEEAGPFQEVAVTKDINCFILQ